jgi:hypothetical protein
LKVFKLLNNLHDFLRRLEWLMLLYVTVQSLLYLYTSQSLKLGDQVNV